MVGLPNPSPGEEPARDALRAMFTADLLGPGCVPVCELEASVDTAIGEAGARLRGWIQECAAGLDSISPLCQIGFHELDTGHIFVSDILDPGEPFQVPSCEPCEAALAALEQ